MESKLKKKGTPPPRYDEAFKAGAVRMVTEQRREPKEVARDLGICIDILRSRLKGAGMQVGRVSRHNRDQQCIRKLEAELRSLRKRLCEKDEVIDILKKNPSASCPNHRGEIPLRPHVALPGNPCGAGARGLGGLAQRLLRLGVPQTLWAGTEQSDASAETGGAAPEVPPWDWTLHPMLKPEFGCSHKRVHRQLRLAGIVSGRHRAYKVTTNSRHSYPPAPNLLQRKFSFDSQIKPE